jgi:rhomboid family GlyGly-CTERM serine protease
VPWTAVSLSLSCLALAFAPETWLSLLEYDRGEIARGQWWRLWSAHLAHFSTAHAAANAVTFLALGALAERQAGTRDFVRMLALGAPIIGIGLWIASPELATYRGLSALAWSAATLAFLAHWPMPAYQSLGALALGALVLAKLVMDAASGAAGSAFLPDGVRPEAGAHLLGVLATLGIGLCQRSLHGSARGQTASPR